MALKSILNENFRIKYCKEEINWSETEKSVLHAPMVSFCGSMPFRVELDLTHDAQ